MSIFYEEASTPDRSAERKPSRADIVTYVEWLVFMPGWSFVVPPFNLPAYYFDENVVNVRIMRQVQDTSLPPMYTKALDYSFTKDVTVRLDEVNSLDDVGYRILSACIEWLNDNETNEHEAREFFRIHVGSHPETDTGPDNWQAPFHPHRLSGRARWNDRTGGQSQGC